MLKELQRFDRRISYCSRDYHSWNDKKMYVLIVSFQSPNLHHRITSPTINLNNSSRPVTPSYMQHHQGNITDNKLNVGQQILNTAQCNNNVQLLYQIPPSGAPTPIMNHNVNSPPHLLLQQPNQDSGKNGNNKFSQGTTQFFLPPNSGNVTYMVLNKDRMSVSGTNVPIANIHGNYQGQQQQQHILTSPPPVGVNQMMANISQSSLVSDIDDPNKMMKVSPNSTKVWAKRSGGGVAERFDQGAVGGSMMDQSGQSHSNMFHGGGGGGAMTKYPQIQSVASFSDPMSPRYDSNTRQHGQATAEKGQKIHVHNVHHGNARVKYVEFKSLDRNNSTQLQQQQQKQQLSPNQQQSQQQQQQLKHQRQHQQQQQQYHQLQKQQQQQQHQFMQQQQQHQQQQYIQHQQHQQQQHQHQQQQPHLHHQQQIPYNQNTYYQLQNQAQSQQQHLIVHTPGQSPCSPLSSPPALRPPPAAPPRTIALHSPPSLVPSPDVLPRFAYVGSSSNSTASTACNSPAQVAGNLQSTQTPLGTKTLNIGGSVYHSNNNLPRIPPVLSPNQDKQQQQQQHTKNLMHSQSTPHHIQLPALRQDGSSAMQMKSNVSNPVLQGQSIVKKKS